MRFIIRNNHDVDGITEELIKLIRDQYGVDYCAVFDFGDTTRRKAEGIEYYSYKYCTYNDLPDFDMYKEVPLPRNVLDDMLKYKSIALDIVIRECNYDVYTVQFARQIYYRQLQFWYGFLKDKRIDFAVFMLPPHHIGEFILYSLCEVLSIRKTVYIPVLPKGCFLPCTSIWNSNSYYLKVAAKLDTEKCNINENFKNYLDKVKSFGTYSGDEMRRIQVVVNAQLFSPSDNPMVFFRRLIRAMLIRILPKYSNNREFQIEENRRKIQLLRNIRRKKRDMDDRRTYNKLSIAPDLDQKFIYFALQQEPEETTLPRAGEFRNQLLSILILSDAVKRLGIKLYVKEHWTERIREKGFYSKIANMNNVELIDITYNSCDLIRHSVAVASQTGSCLFEALILGKSSLVFGEGYPFIGAPGSHFVSSSDEVVDIISGIIQYGDECSQEERNRYILAYQESCIDFYCNSLEEAPKTYNMNNTAKKMLEFIEHSSNNL